MSVIKSGVLADLESRAGASDQDRELWLAERRAGITATEVRDLTLGKLRAQDLIDLKLGRKVDSFSGNAYTEWGKQRESVIAESIAGKGFDAESRVFHAHGNSRFLASPDAVASTFDDELFIAEIKTSGKRLIGDPAALDASGYVLQMQWQMFVTGASACLLVVEQRLGQPGSFRVGPSDQHWFHRDETVIGELVAVAAEFLEELDRQREDGAPVIDEVVDTHALNYLRGLAAEKEGAELKKSAYAALIAAGVSQESPLARVTFTPGKPGGEFEEEVVDLEAAAVAFPKETAALERAKARVEKLQGEWDVLANTCVKTVTVVTKGTAARVTVTAGKGTR